MDEIYRLLGECNLTLWEYDDGWVRVLDNNKVTVFNGHQLDVLNFLLGVSYEKHRLAEVQGK